MGDKPLTTGQIARLLGCASRTVSKWIDSGLLPGYRLPRAGGPGDRRVAPAAFDEFCRAHELVIVAPYGLVEGRASSGDDDPDPPPVAEAALDAAETRRAA